MQVQGFASFIIARKLKYIKDKLKIWNNDVFGDIKIQKHNLLVPLVLLIRKRSLLALLVLRFSRNQLLRLTGLKIILMEEISWRQKSRAIWLQARGS